MGGLDGLREAMSSGSLVAAPLALLGGVAAGLNPCCLAVYPAVAGACCSTPHRPVARPVGNAIAFLLGLATAVSLLGATVVLSGRVAAISEPVRYAIAAMPILLGLRSLGWIRLPAVPAFRRGGGMASAFLAGLLISLVVGPCGTPVLAAVLSYVALSRHMLQGITLMFLFGLGAGLPAMAFGTATGAALDRLGAGRPNRWLDPTMGALLIALGLYLLWRA